VGGKGTKSLVGGGHSKLICKREEERLDGERHVRASQGKQTDLYKPPWKVLLLLLGEGRLLRKGRLLPEKTNGPREKRGRSSDERFSRKREVIERGGGQNF